MRYYNNLWIPNTFILSITGISKSNEQMHNSVLRLKCSSFLHNLKRLCMKIILVHVF